MTAVVSPKMSNICETPDFFGDLLCREAASVKLPVQLLGLYWLLIMIIFLLAAVTHAGHAQLSLYTSTCKSVLSLIFLDTLSFQTLLLSSLLLIPAAVLTRPWQSLSPTFVGPMAAFIAACLSCTRMQTYERRLLTLWLRAGGMLITNEMQLNLTAVSKAVQAAKAAPLQNEASVIALTRADTKRGIGGAARNKGSARPLMTALQTWWHQGNAAQLPRTVTRTSSVPYLKVRARNCTHRTTLEALQDAGTALLREGDEEEGEQRLVRVVSSFDKAARRVVHAGFGNIWMTVAGRAGVEGGGEGWWYVGAEVVQAIKAATGVRSLSAEGRYDDIGELWQWVGKLGYGWRREFQTEGIARTLGREMRIDVERAVQVARRMADGLSVEEFSEAEVVVGREANAVACLGLAVGACISELQFRLEEVCRQVVVIVGGVEGVWIEEGADGAMLMAVDAGDWPEEQLARMLFRWVGEAAVAMGRAGGPEVGREN